MSQTYDPLSRSQALESNLYGLWAGGIVAAGLNNNTMYYAPGNEYLTQDLIHNINGTEVLGQRADVLIRALNEGSIYGSNVYSDSIYNLVRYIISTSISSVQFMNMLFNSANLLQSPLVLDLDGDGIETTSLQNGAYFDHNNNGLAEQSAWVGADDGLLVLDRNADGFINGGNEVFGDNTLLSNSSYAAQGFAALAELDTNSDGKIDASDAQFADLQVLKGDGTLHSLADLDIASLSLSYGNYTTTDANGNQNRYHGSYTKTDTTTGEMSDIYFVNNTTYRIDTDPLELSTEVAALPDVQGYGNVYDLSQAMMRDSSGDLQDLVEDFVAATTMADREALLDDILYKWSDAANQPQNDFNNNTVPFTTSMTLATLEQFMGRSYDGNFSAQISQNQGTTLFEAFYILRESVYSQLASQTSVASYIDAIEISFNTLTSSANYDLDSLIDLIEADITTNASTGKAILEEVTRVLKGLNIVSASNYQDYYDAFSALGSEYKLILDQAGLLHFNGTSSADTLNGLSMTLFTADQTAQQQISEVFAAYGGTQAGDGIMAAIGAAEVFHGGVGNDTISAKAGDDYLYGEADNDSLDGGEGNDLLLGGTGNDTLQGAENNDTLSGDTGNDLLYGGSGNDTYLFNVGDGVDVINELSFTDTNDTLVLGAGITANDIYFTNDGIYNNLYLKFTSGSDAIQISGGLSGQVIEKIKFADNSELTISQALSQMKIVGTSGNDAFAGSSFGESLYGAAGDDDLSGNGGNDSVYGGTGNDLLRGGTGNDQYYYASGDGQDTIYEESTGTDQVVFSDLLQSGITFSADGNNLVAKINSSSDKVTIYRGLDSSDTQYQVESFKFSDNSVLTYAQVLSSLQTVGTSGGDFMSGSGLHDVILGLGGNDFILAGDGNDNISGGTGGDLLWGQNGNDFISGDEDDDSINGNDGNDTIIGGTGNDDLAGGTGNDTFIFQAGDGRDVVSENASEGTDSIVLGAGLTQSETYFRPSINGSIEIAFENHTTDWIRLNSQISNAPFETLVFADNTTVSLANVSNNLEFRGTASGESIQASDYSELISGYGGNDNLYGYNGNDTLDGGTGNDFMMGGNGNDTYVVDSSGDTVADYSGQGTDTVKASIDCTLGSDIENLTLTGTSNLNGTGNSADNIITGNSGTNSLTGATGNDTLQGGTGNDTLTGGADNDTYLFAKGDGVDSVSDSSGSADKLLFDSSVTQANLAIFLDGSGNLKIGYTDSAGDVITVQGQNSSGVERFELSNGNYMSDSDISAIISDMAAYATTNSVSFTSLDDVKNDAGLLAIVNGGWHS